MLRQNQVEQFDEQHARCGGDDERQGTEAEDEDTVDCQELAGLGGGTYGDTEQDGDGVNQRATGSLGQAACHTRFFQQVTEEEHTQQGQTTRYQETGVENKIDTISGATITSKAVVDTLAEVGAHYATNFK